MSVDVLRRLHCYLHANVMVNKLYILWCIMLYAWLILYWHGEGREVRTIAAKIECAHRRACTLFTDCNQKILNCHLIYDYFALLKYFNTNSCNFHQYFKDKLSSHQPSPTHNTTHRTNSNFNTPLFNHSKTQKCYMYKEISKWNSLPNSLQNYTSKFTFKKQIKSHLLASQS